MLSASVAAAIKDLKADWLLVFEAPCHGALVAAHVCSLLGMGSAAANVFAYVCLNINNCRPQRSPPLRMTWLSFADARLT